MIYFYFTRDEKRSCSLGIVGTRSYTFCQQYHNDKEEIKYSRSFVT